MSQKIGMKLFLKLFLSLIILSSFGEILIGEDGIQIFAKYAETKKILLPIFYLIFIFFVVTRNVGTNLEISRSIRFILWSLALTTWLSLLKSFLLPQQSIQLNFLLQSLLQIGGLILFIHTGTLIAHYDEKIVYDWVIVAAICSSLSAIVGLNLSPFILIYIPMSFFLIYVSKTLKLFWRLPAISLGVICLYYSTYRMLGSESPSIAWYLELGSIFILFVSLYVKRRTRKTIYIALWSITPIILPFTPLFKLLIGKAPASTKDVTLLQRAFETSEVLKVLFRDPITWLFGLGPGGYLNMTWAPDFRTLILSGRNLEMVDDTHFLTSWILLKLGFVGLSIFISLVFLVLKSTMLILSQEEKVNPLDFLFSANIIGGISIAITAGTNFFTNPLLGISIGVIFSRAKVLERLNPRHKF